MPRRKQARTLADIQKDIERLNQEAARIRATEVAGVVGRIKEAIKFYELTAADLFDASKKKSSPKAMAPAAPAKKTRILVPKYKDPNSDKTWTGHARRPAWFLAALDAGKKPEDMAI